MNIRQSAKRSSLVIAVLLAVALALIGCASNGNGEVTTITEAGSTTVQPLAQDLADAFMADNPDVEITVQGGGSSVGIQSAADGTVDIGAASRAVKPEEIALGLVVHHLASDGIAIVVHPDQTVDELTTDDVRQIFAGDITNWSEVGGADAEITVIAREEGSGTRAAFEELVMDEELITETAILLPSNGAVRTSVSTTPDSIGFVSFGYLDGSVKALDIDGVAATVANALSGDYPVVRPLNFVTKGEPTGKVKEFIDFCLSAEGQAIVAEDYIPVLVEPLSGTITEAGSTTVQPLAQSLADAFMAENPDVEITVQGGGSSVGIQSAADGTADIGAASRAVKPEEIALGLVVHHIASDGIAIVTHPSQTVNELTTDQVRQIFAGDITNWSEVGGADAAITVIAREEGSGTRAAFEELVMEEELITETALLFPSNGAVRTAVSTTPDAIGFLSFGYLDGSAKALDIDGVAATVANALSGDYPVVRPLNFVTKGQPTGVLKAFIDFCLSAEGQAIVAEDYIPVG